MSNAPLLVTAAVLSAAREEMVAVGPPEPLAVSLLKVAMNYISNEFRLLFLSVSDIEVE